MIPEVLGRLAIWLMQADVGLGLAVLVGLSMSVSHLFALVANRLTPRQIAVQLVLDGLVLALALLLGILFNILMIKALTGAVLHPSELLDKLGAALIPGLFYCFVAAPYISDLIATVIWFLIHLNVVTLLHARLDLPYDEALMMATPGFVVALLLVMALFHQGWQASYRRLASELLPDAPV
jgi:hypothetical protein